MTVLPPPLPPPLLHRRLLDWAPLTPPPSPLLHCMLLAGHLLAPPAQLLMQARLHQAALCCTGPGDCTQQSLPAGNASPAAAVTWPCIPTEAGAPPSSRKLSCVSEGSWVHQPAAGPAASARSAAASMPATAGQSRQGVQAMDAAAAIKNSIDGRKKYPQSNSSKEAERSKGCRGIVGGLLARAATWGRPQRASTQQPPENDRQLHRCGKPVSSQAAMSFAAALLKASGWQAAAGGRRQRQAAAAQLGQGVEVLWWHRLHLGCAPLCAIGLFGRRVLRSARAAAECRPRLGAAPRWQPRSLSETNNSYCGVLKPHPSRVGLLASEATLPRSTCKELHGQPRKPCTL